MEITKGEWKYRVKHRGSCKDALIQVVIPNGVALTLGRIGEDDCTVETCCCTEEHSNAKLIAEAGTVTNECGLTPRQLLEQRNELMNALRESLRKLKEYTGDDSYVDMISKLDNCQVKEAVK